MRQTDIRELLKLLTPAEQAVVMHLFLGKTNREIGRSIGLREKTVKSHLTSVYRKAGCNADRQLLSRFRWMESEPVCDLSDPREDEHDEPGVLHASELVPPP